MSEVGYASNVFTHQQEQVNGIMAEIIPSEGGGWFMRETFLLSPSSLTFKPVIQSWLVQHDRCEVCGCEDRKAWDSLIWKSKTREGKFISSC